MRNNVPYFRRLPAAIPAPWQMYYGITCDLADAAMGTAMASTLEDDENFTTLDLTTKFFKPVWTARLRTTSHVNRRRDSRPAGC